MGLAAALLAAATALAFAAAATLAFAATTALAPAAAAAATAFLAALLGGKENGGFSYYNLSPRTSYPMKASRSLQNKSFFLICVMLSC